MRALAAIRFLAWLAIGAAVVLQVTALGLLVLPVALVAVVVLVATGPPRRPELGALAIGMAAAVLTIAGFALFGGTGFDPLPWLVVGAALAVLGAAAIAEGGR